MKRTLVATIAASLALLAAPASQAQVDAGKAEAKAKEIGCLSCHRISSKKTGPALNEVAKKYKGGSIDKMIADIKANKEHADDLKEWKDDDLKLVAAWVQSL
jgi:cytochrome c551/c552